MSGVAGRTPVTELQTRGAIDAIRSDLKAPNRLLPGHLSLEDRTALGARLADRCAELAALIPAWDGPLGQAHALAVARNAHKTAMAAVAAAVANLRSERRRAN